MKPFTSFFHIFTFTILLSQSAAYALDNIPDNISAWSEQGAVLQQGAPGSWDEKTISPIGLSKKDGIYYLYYISGFDGCWNEHGDINHKSVGLATSTDGVNFTKYTGNPILKPHDFVPVNSHEEGIRLASIRYLPHLQMWLGYFSVESPGGADTCPFMGSEAQCSCNISVDSSIYAATSADGKNWTVKGEVQGVYNGAENYVDDFQFANGQYYVWTHRAEGGQIFHASSGTDFMNLNPLGEISQLCWGWSILHTFLHDDGKTVSTIYDPNGGCAASNDNLYFAKTSLDNMKVLTNEKVIHSKGEQVNSISKDVENGEWRWYYRGSDLQTIHLRTHPLIAGSTDTTKPASPNPLTAN